MRIVDIALKDLTEILRDIKSLLFLVLMPVIFTLVFGFAFSSTEQDARLPIGWVDRDAGSALSVQLRDMVAAGGGLRLVPLTGDEAQIEKQVSDEKIVAAAIVPEGFSLGALAGEAPPLTLIVPPSMAGQTATTALQAATKRLLGALQAARLAVEAQEAAQPFAGEAARQAALEESLAAAIAGWKEPALALHSEAATGLATAKGGMPSGFQQSSPGMLVQFAIFGLITSAMVLVLERKGGTLRRMLMAPVGRAEGMAGHLLAMFAVAFLQGLLLVALGQLAFGVGYLRQPLGTLLMLVALGLWVTSLGLLIGALAKIEEHVIVYALIAMFVFAALGGAWFPLEVAGSTFSRIGHLLPTAWAMDGLQNIVVRGLGWGSVLLPAGMLIGYAAVFFGLAVWRFRFE